jgi:hypothetical protein
MRAWLGPCWVDGFPWPFALTLLNDVITREVFRVGASLIDLRLICDSDEDFANPIEPSALGGAKIARAIARFASGDRGASAVFA